MKRRKVLLSWSSGKDSAWSLHTLRRDPSLEVVGLLTTLNEEFDRVAMHAVRAELLRLQAAAAGLPSWPVPLPYPCSNEQYESIMAGVVAKAVAEGDGVDAFGNLFLADIRAYRERQMAGSGLDLLFPLWESATAALAREMVAARLRAWVTSVDPRRLDASFCGREWDASFLDDLPAGVDPCGENGEFHTFVYAGPMLDRTLAVTRGEAVERDGYVFTDLLPA